MAAPSKISVTVSIFLLSLCLLAISLSFVVGSKDNQKGKDGDSEKWKKKDIRDYTDADLEKLYDQWEEADEDELEDDEQPPWKQEPPKVDMSKLDASDPEGFLRESKKGRALMIFVSVAGNPTKAEAEKVTSLWQSSLFNANIEVQRYMVSDDRAIFQVNDGSQAWDIKDFLIKQELCKEVTIDGKSYPGIGAVSTKTEL